MSFFELLIIAISLAMDAFAVAVSNGLMLPKIRIRHALVFGLFFGVFQFLMPLIGYFLASRFSTYIQSFDHWIAFILLSIIGGNMIKESFSDEDDEDVQANIMSVKNLTMLAIATSIDALAVGVTFALVDSGNIWVSCGVIGIVAFILSYIGVMLGKKISGVFQSYAERVGGAVLIIIGLKILIEHLFFS